MGSGPDPSNIFALRGERNFHPRKNRVRHHFSVRRGRFIVIVLNAGDKSLQKRDIRRALKLATELGDD